MQVPCISHASFSNSIFLYTLAQKTKGEKWLIYSAKALCLS